MAKASFDREKIKAWFVAHGEKAAFGACVVTALAVTYFALKVPVNDKQASDLQQQLSDTEKQYSQKKIDLAAANAVVDDRGFKGLIQALLVKDIDPALYAGSVWNKPVVDTNKRRGEPVYLALRNLRAVHHFGPIYLKSEAAAKLGSVDGGAEPTGGNNADTVPWGKQWICVTGIAPLEEQHAEYAKAFGGTVDPDTNAVPIYAEYVLERRDVTYDADAPWEAVITSKDLSAQQPQPAAAGVTYRERILAEELAQWAGTGAETVDPSFIRWNPANTVADRNYGELPIVLTEPMPPLANKDDYGDWCSHPLLADAALPAAAPQPGAAQPPAAGDGEAPAKLSRYALFRYFDFGIEVGKKYQYRVMLTLKNPNYKLDVSRLEPNKNLGEGKVRPTPMSEPSNEAEVPLLDRFFAGEVKPVAGDTEPTVDVGVKKWRPNAGAFVYYEFQGKGPGTGPSGPPGENRGALLNHSAANYVFLAPGNRKGEKRENVLLDTNALLLDFSWERSDRRVPGPDPGAGLTPRASTRPSEVLLYTDRGELVITGELMDWRYRTEMEFAKTSPGIGDAGSAPVAPAAGGTTPVAPSPSPSTTKPTLRLK